MFEVGSLVEGPRIATSNLQKLKKSVWILMKTLRLMLMQNLEILINLLDKATAVKVCGVGNQKDWMIIAILKVIVVAWKMQWKPIGNVFCRVLLMKRYWTFFLNLTRSQLSLNLNDILVYASDAKKGGTNEMCMVYLTIEKEQRHLLSILRLT